MKLQFLGAARQVTGSQYLVEADGAKILVDCGMYQEREFLARNWEPGPVPPNKLDAILLTHAHLDHCGLVPKLVAEGFRGRIIATEATADLAGLVLHDSAEIQAEDVAYKKKRHKREGRKGKYPVKPLYTTREVARTLKLLERVPYQQPVAIGDGLSAVFHDAGHILGSAIIELSAARNGRTRRLVFSGDLGQWNKPIVRDPTGLAEADLIVMESTYGARDHEAPDNVESRLAEVIVETAQQGGNLVVPVFAIERAQELVYHVSRLLSAKRIPKLPVFLDSPMAADVTEVFRRHKDYFDREAWQMIASGDSPLGFPGLTMTRSVEQSKAINEHQGPAIIMATSGMCTAGRIKFHLRRNIVRPESTILFVGYQARGTLGRGIVQRQPEVRIHGRQYHVKARVEQIQGFSGHADRSALMRWLGFFQKPPEHLFLTHGDEDEALSLAERVREELGWEVSVPEYRDVAELP